MANATGVTGRHPSESKGVLEIFPNPWDEEKAMLLVERSDEWGYLTLFSYKTSDSYKISAEGGG